MSTGPEEDEQSNGERRSTERGNSTKQTGDIDRSESTTLKESLPENHEEEDQWRFSVDDFDDGDDDQSSGGDGSNVAGTLESRQPLEPGDINLENAFFVAVGILIVVGLIVGAMLGL